MGRQPWSKIHKKMLKLLRTYRGQLCMHCFFIGDEDALVTEESEETKPREMEIADPGMLSSRMSSRWVSYGSVIFLILVFAPCMTYHEWHLDERYTMVREKEMPFWALLPEFMNSSVDNGHAHETHRPHPLLFSAVQNLLKGGVITPQLLRAFNIGLHMANSMLLLCFLRRQCGSPRWAWLAAGLFAVHPLHTENVIHVVGQADTLATHCWLWAMLSWSVTKPGCRRFLPLCLSRVVLLAVIGGLCKEVGLFVLLQLATAEFVAGRRLQGLPFISAFAILFLAETGMAKHSAAHPTFSVPSHSHDNLAVHFSTLVYYHGKCVQLLALPWTQALDHSYDALPLLWETWRDVRALSAATACLAVAALTSWILTLRSRRAFLGLSNLIIPFLPVSNLLSNIGAPLNERFLYPCNVGGAMLVAAIGMHVERVSMASPHSRMRYRRSGLFIMGFLLLLVYVYLCHSRVRQWSSTKLLFEADAVSFPRSAKLRYQLGTVLHREAHFEDALHHYEASLSIFKENTLARYCMAQIFIVTFRWEEAKTHFEEIPRYDTLGLAESGIFLVNYGFVLAQLQQYNEALVPLRRGLELNEAVPHGWNALGYCLAHLLHTQEAADAFETALRYDPKNPSVMNNLGASLFMLNQVDRGSKLVRESLLANPTHPAFQHNANIVDAFLKGRGLPSHFLVVDLSSSHPSFSC